MRVHRRLTSLTPLFAPQDFYENLFMSEKIVDGHVKLALVRLPLARDIAPPPQPGHDTRSPIQSRKIQQR